MCVPVELGHRRDRMAEYVVVDPIADHQAADLPVAEDVDRRAVVPFARDPVKFDVRIVLLDGAWQCVASDGKNHLISSKPALVPQRI